MPSLRKLSGPLDEYFLPPCTKVDPAIFMAARKILVAKRICMTCPIDVRRDCLQIALDQDERRGVRGGLSAAERVDFKRRQKDWNAT